MMLTDKSDSSNGSNVPKDTLFVQCLKRFFRIIGKSVAARPFCYITIISFVSIIFSFPILTTKLVNDVTDFTPKEARARKELQNGLVINNQFNETSSLIHLAYPTANILGQKFRTDNNFFGVKVDKNNVLIDARLIVLHFRASLHDGIDTAEEYELKVSKFLLTNFTSNYIEIAIMSPTFVTAEIVRSGLHLLPFIAVGFIIMCVFATTTTMMSTSISSQFDYFKVIVATMACVSPLLACSTALGFLIWIGLRFGTILCVTPFLVLAIGVDDAFLMINSWQRNSKLYKQLATKCYNENESAIITDRICGMLEEVGPSVSITTLTNVLAFGVGAFSSTPEIQIFSVGNASAMIFDFIYQITLFVAILVIVGRRELKIKKCPSTVESIASRSKRQNEIGIVLKNFLKSYCSFICNPSVAIVIITGLFFYWSVSIYGALTINVELRPEKLLASDSNILKVLKLRNEYILPHYTTTLIFVENPGNLNNSNNILMLHKMVNDFETLPSSVGRMSTKFWLRDYETFIETTERDYFDGFPDKCGNKYLKSYFFMITSRGDFQIWSNRAKLLNELRTVADRYSVYEVTVYDDDAKFLDLIETLLNQTMLSSAITLLSMVLVCFIFIPQFLATSIAALSILSIFIGVFGILSLWGVDLDPIVMSAMIMSIGFSVDIPAHVSYHFFRAEGATVEVRLLHCLAAIAYPVLQAAMSTLFCVLSLLFSELYMARVFVKTMTLVVVIGLIHGLIIVPALYALISKCKLPRKKKVFQVTNGTTPPKDILLSNILNTTETVDRKQLTKNSQFSLSYNCRF
ncbi:unnamed protein product [Thelazia callipaeda]|uniref:SSD domain-containing protein n=1 Tax=Thelazia callipaeda TaxID=103827 RepID=A0A0N5D2H0_THECL|nr:unnamed protein product [Thelazia callipaeda]